MFQIKQPSNIIIGKKSAREFQFQENCLIITSKGTKKRGWLEYLDLGNYQLFDDVEPNPSIDTVKKIINEFSKSNITHVIGLGGGSSLDVAKYVGFPEGQFAQNAFCQCLQPLPPDFLVLLCLCFLMQKQLKQGVLQQ